MRPAKLSEKSPNTLRPLQRWPNFFRWENRNGWMNAWRIYCWILIIFNCHIHPFMSRIDRSTYPSLTLLFHVSICTYTIGTYSSLKCWYEESQSIPYDLSIRAEQRVHGKWLHTVEHGPIICIFNLSIMGCIEGLGWCACVLVNETDRWRTGAPLKCKKFD